MKTIKNKKAEGYVDVAVAVLVISFLLVFLVSVFGLVMQKQNLNYMANELVDAATTYGKVGSELQNRFEALCEETGLHPVMSIDTTYFDASAGTVQLGHVISISLEMNASLLGFGDFVYPFIMTSSASGLSHVYWK